MPDRVDEVLALVRYHLNRPPWRVTEIYKKAVKVDGRLARKGLEWFRQHYVIPILNGEKEVEDDTPVEISVPGSLTSRLRRRMQEMETSEERERREAAFACPCGEYWTDSRQGIALHLSKSHTDEEEEKWRRELGLGAKGTKVHRQPLLLSAEKQEQVLKILERGTEVSYHNLPDREKVREAFLSFAREVRDTSDALEVAASLDTFVDLMYDLFTEKADGGPAD